MPLQVRAGCVSGKGCTLTSHTDFTRLDAVSQAELVRSGAASALELVDSAINRVTATNPTVNAVIWERFEAARDEAERARPGAPFTGVPLLLKDMNCPAIGFPDHRGCAALKGKRNSWDHDGAMVRRFRGAGFILLGSTNVPELGLICDSRNAAYGATRNPWNTAYCAGGSSGGSAAAVASGMVPVAHGNDGGGSIRIPAGHCGLVGMKPTRGRVSHAPDAGEPMFGHVTSGVLTRTVRDTAQILDILSGYEPGDPSAPAPLPTGFAGSLQTEPGRLRIGFVDRPAGDKWRQHPDCVLAVGTAASLLADLGHTVEESHPGALFEPEYWDRWFDTLSPTVSQVVDWIASLQDGGPVVFDAVTTMWVERGRSLSAQDLAETLEWMDGYRRRLLSWWAGGFDLLLSPVFPMPPPVSGHLWTYPDGISDSVDILQFTPQFNTSGQPAISVPMLWNADNLPIGIQLVAGYGREDLLLQVAQQIERARPWLDHYSAALTPVS